MTAIIRYITITILLFATQTVYAGVYSASVEGNTFQVSGFGFGTLPEYPVWIGDHIEAGVDNADVVLPANWESSTTTSNFQAPKYSSTQAHSGNRSILCEITPEEKYCSGFVYRKPSAYEDVYVSWWFYSEPLTIKEGSTYGQIKYFRLSEDGNGGIFGGSEGMYFLSQLFTEPDYDNTSLMVYIFCTGAHTQDTTCYTDPDSVYATNKPIKKAVYQRFEVWYESSTPGVADGKLYISVTDESSGTIYFAHHDGIVTRPVDPVDLSLVVWQNYWGNGGGLAKFYIDDPYIQFGTQQRVEIGNAPVFANCTHREIQPALTWSDNGITGTFNQGSFEVGDTVYFFVIDENGIPSDGYPVTIGGEPSIADPIVEILTESGQTTTASVFTITGTATADTDQIISGVSCSGQTVTPDDGTWDEQSEAFTCLANLALGENTLVFIGSDGTRTGQDSITVARIKKTSKINGSATIKNATIHQ